MKKMNEGDPISVGILALGMAQLSYAIVVDEDVDIYDLREVLWAVVTRARPDEDFVIIPRAKGNRLDPTTYDRLRDKKGSMVTKTVIDATVKTGVSRDQPKVIREPLVRTINLAEYGII